MNLQQTAVAVPHAGLQQKEAAHARKTMCAPASAHMQMVLPHKQST